MRKPHELNVRRYTTRMIYLNTYLVAFNGAKAGYKIGETVFNDFFRTTCQIYGSGKHTCRVLVVNKLFKNMQTCLNAWKYQNLFMKMLWNFLIKNILGYMTTMLISVGKREYKPPYQIFTPR